MYLKACYVKHENSNPFRFLFFMNYFFCLLGSHFYVESICDDIAVTGYFCFSFYFFFQRQRAGKDNRRKRNSNLRFDFPFSASASMQYNVKVEEFFPFVSGENAPNLRLQSETPKGKSWFYMEWRAGSKVLKKPFSPLYYKTPVNGQKECNWKLLQRSYYPLFRKKEDS